MISSILGIIVGLAVAPYLLGRVLDVLAVDNLVFLRDIHMRSFGIAAALAFLFTLVMMLVTFIRLFRINMIESLKSVD
jgi:putative ABC transport system permease protein